MRRDRWVRRALDLLQLAAFRGMPLEQLPLHLAQAVALALPELDPAIWSCCGSDGVPGQMVVQWRDWCLARGLLTYGIVTELFGRYLLPHPTYQAKLRQRFSAVFADDVDNYPAIARADLFEVAPSAQWGINMGVFAYNPNGGHSLGAGGRPRLYAGVERSCPVPTSDATSRCIFRGDDRDNGGGFSADAAVSPARGHSVHPS